MLILYILFAIFSFLLIILIIGLMKAGRRADDIEERIFEIISSGPQRGIKMQEKTRRSGVDIIGDVPWGTHLCLFYQTKADLIDILVPYFKAGLENNEFCMWITSEPLKAEDAKQALMEAMKDLDDYIKRGQIEILDASQWYTKSGKSDSDEVLQGWLEKENQALTKGYDGLRLTGNTFWLEKKDWKEFTDYEAAINNTIGKHRMIVICSYSLDKYGASEIADVISNHQFAVIVNSDRQLVCTKNKASQLV